MLWPIIRQPALGGWEQDLMSHEDLSVYLCHLLVWHRYIDDVHMVWDGPLNLLEDFLCSLNQNNHNLRFTCQIGREQDLFLDLAITIDQKGQLPSNIENILQAIQFYTLLVPTHYLRKNQSLSLNI